MATATKAAVKAAPKAATKPAPKATKPAPKAAPKATKPAPKQPAYVAQLSPCFVPTSATNPLVQLTGGYSPRGVAANKTAPKAYAGQGRHNYTSWALLSTVLAVGPVNQQTLVNLLTYAYGHTCFVRWRLAQGGIALAPANATPAPSANGIKALAAVNLAPPAGAPVFGAK